MKKIFITYGDKGYVNAKKKIINEAKLTNEFTNFYSYDRSNLSKELLSSPIIQINRGGGLWSWKPDIIFTTMQQLNIGDVIVYCDAGCSLYSSSEWKFYWKQLDKYDIIAQRMYHLTYKWTRKELLDFFNDNGVSWRKMCQFMATAIIIKVSEFTIEFIKEWRSLMISHSELIMDVNSSAFSLQHTGFIQNRHDQAAYSALIYKYLKDDQLKNKIFCKWEHIDYFDPFYKQAIRATRLRNGGNESLKQKLIGGGTRIIKDYILRPFYYSPLNWYYSKRN